MPSERAFKLNAKQLERLNAWFKKLKPPDPYDEDCVGTSYFRYHFQPSGIGDTVHVSYALTGEILDLTLGDDGEFIHAE